ncbi:MAG TPA: hypothetical protein PLF01_04845 [Alphaproteobacteria bacterium]|nr:hypothetical protein [Alphaproteobacteria bacterium]
MIFRLIIITLLCLPSVAQAQTCQGVSDRIVDGQKWIINAQRDNGLFTYEYRPLEDRFTNEDNMVRQTGTFWVLIESLKYHRDDAVLATIEKFRKKISSMIIRSKAGDDDIAYIEFNGFGKINTSALYILSLLSLEEHGLELTEQEKKDMDLVITGMRKMSDEEGGFWYLYYLPKEHNIITSYGSGEALFALAKYYDKRNDMAGLEWTYKEFMKYFDRFLKNEDDFQVTEARAFFSWGIYALSIINQKFPIDYNKTVKHMVDMAFNKRKTNPLCKDRGCFLLPNLGDATFFEGIVQAYKLSLIYEKDPKEIQKLRDYLELALADYKDLQIIDIYKFRYEYRFEGRAKNVLGAFCWDKRCTQIRNDLTQHAVSAFIYYSEEFCKAPEKEENKAD